MMAGNEIIRSGNADDKSLPAATRNKITKGLSNINNANISKALTTIFHQVDIGTDFVKHLQRGKVYLAEIPRKLQADFDAGKLQLMTIKETGEQVSEIVGLNNFGTRGHMIIKDAGFIHSNIPHDLASIAMQQQLAQMAAVIDEVRSRIIEMQQTYDESLLGELRGMRDQLAQVQNVEDLDNQRDLIKGAITHLNLTRGKIVQRLISELQKMPEIPQKAWRRFLKTFFKEGFRGKVIDGYEKIQELFSYYLAASQLLAYAYALLGEQRTYEDIFTPELELMQESSLENLIRSEDIVGVEGERWYSNPQNYLELIKREAHNVFLRKEDVITIEVTGEQLLEATNSVRAEGKELQDKG